ncbi:DNA repair protein RadC [Sporomusa sphaeroides DSM 2875]|uniref:JAB domain-containing protein n=1 Tax=Sporomusa sphaeroides TaxID=47679 RepID=UPI00202E07F7|nr:DNA repair protein RadC [Sporomusa sphaeroides]MCM0757774.1 DNA repair protein RadC [Sporomusa sphaeroides DSM 2875]
MEGMRTLLAGCLRERANGYVVDALIENYPNVSELMNASEKEISSIKGIGLVKAKQLSAILEFARKVYTPDKNKRIIVRSPRDVFDLVRADMEFLRVEHFDVIGLSTKNHVLFKENISIGSLNASIVHPREAFKGLIRRSCAACILVHNHPSSDPLPSNEDILLTKKLGECGKLIGIEVLDHIIVGADGGGYFSLKEQGRM